MPTSASEPKLTSPVPTGPVPASHALKGTPARVTPWERRYGGVLAAGLVLTAWALNLVVLYHLNWHWANPWVYVGILIQMHLYSGVFITAHDAMHHTVHPNPRINHGIGWVCALLFAYNWYPKLYRNHHRHHLDVATHNDPDVHPGSLLTWFLKFARGYISVWQVLAMAITFNAFKLGLGVSVPFLVFGWMLPAILSTFQIFYFGTYRPHKPGPDTANEYASRTLKRGHVVAFISCYFFGYHREHHAQPHVPWWALPRTK